MEHETEDWLEQAQQVADLPVPLAPYWDGRNAEDGLEVRIQTLRTEPERQGLYERLFGLIDRNNASVQEIPRTGFSSFEIQDRALSSLKRAFRDEAWEDEEEQPQDRVSLSARLGWILANVERRLDKKPELLEQFCSHFLPTLCDPPENEQIRDWLNRLDSEDKSYAIPADTLLALRILYGGYGSTWNKAGELLLAELDHEDPTIRACAAYQIGTFCRRLAPENEKEDWRRDYAVDREATEGMDSLASYWKLIRDKEIERSGVAGAFWSGAPKWTVDADEWILALVVGAEPEPHIRYFPCGIGFDAHERFSRNPAAIRRMIDAGRVGLALEAATEQNEPIAGMQSILIELGMSDNAEIVRRASWALAYSYHYLHPEGERLGFVQRHTQFADYDLFLLFSLKILESEQPDIPYAVVLYPKAPQSYWTRKTAKALADRVFPPAARGAVRKDEFSDSVDSEQVWHQRGYVRFSPASGDTDVCDEEDTEVCDVSRITIGYRSDVYWNPTKGV